MVESQKKLHRGPNGRERVGSWRGGQPSSPNQLEGSRSGVWGAAPAEIEFGAF